MGSGELNLRWSRALVEANGRPMLQALGGRDG